MSRNTLNGAERIPYGQEVDEGPFYRKPTGEFCPDCGVSEGTIHTLGCDGEQCPQCGEQLIGCDCLLQNNGEHDPN